MVSTLCRSVHSIAQRTQCCLGFNLVFGPLEIDPFSHLLSEGDNGPTVHWKLCLGGFSPTNLLHFGQCFFACCSVSHCLLSFSVP